jgi:hypothetical protein
MVFVVPTVKYATLFGYLKLENKLSFGEALLTPVELRCLHGWLEPAAVANQAGVYLFVCSKNIFNFPALPRIIFLPLLRANPVLNASLMVSTPFT